jgi:hypothetical protein
LKRYSEGTVNPKSELNNAGVIDKEAILQDGNSILSRLSGLALNNESVA